MLRDSVQSFYLHMYKIVLIKINKNIYKEHLKKLRGRKFRSEGF